MIKIGIIAGGGHLPIIIGNNLLNKNYQVSYFCIKNFANIENYNDFDNHEIELTSFSLILKCLKENNIDEIIMVGKISRPTIKDIKFDIKTISLIKDYFLESKGDDQLLKSVSNFFIKNGFPLFDWKKICEELFASDDHLTITKPSTLAKKNMTKGLEVFRILGKADLGQSLIVQNQLILGIECIEGTDELINRCGNYKKNNDKGILLKLTKYNQHQILDLPTIGIDTIKNIKKNQYEGIFIEKNKCIILDQDNVIDFCNNNKIFLSTVEKID